MQCVKRIAVCAFFIASWVQVCYCAVYAEDVTYHKDNSSDSTASAVPKAGEKSLKKCEEYEKLAYEEVKPTPPENGRNHLCPFNASKLLVDDYIAQPKEFPHMVLIGFYYNEEETDWLCARTLISESFVLTAAHCLWSRSHIVPFPTSVKLGDVSLNSSMNDERVQIIEIEEHIGHPDYSRISYHDIGLLKLKSPAKLNAYVRPACLSTKTHLENEDVLFTSWDSSCYACTDTSTLRKRSWKIIDDEKCANASIIGLYGGTIDETQVCTVRRYQEKDECRGDVGGPLTVFKDTKCLFEVVGITSFIGICESASPAVSTRVHPYLKWIESIVWP